MGQKAPAGPQGRVQQNLFARSQSGPPVVGKAMMAAQGMPTGLSAVTGLAQKKKAATMQGIKQTKEIAQPIVGTVAGIIGGMLGGPLAAWGSSKIATSDVGGQINLMYGEPYMDSWRDVAQSTGWQDLGALAGGYIGGAAGGAVGGAGSTAATVGASVGSTAGGYAGGRQPSWGDVGALLGSVGGGYVGGNVGSAIGSTAGGYGGSLLNRPSPRRGIY